MKNMPFIIKALVFLLLAALCAAGVNRLLVPGYFYDDTWPTTNTYADFYALEKNSTDVLFFGSSHCASCFNPVVLYDDYGITSYNLGSEEQSLILSYYWLKEALQYQSPQVVVLDTFLLYLFDEFVDPDLNCEEEILRKAVDSMRLSPVKVSLINDICRYDPTQSKPSFYLQNIRFHARWPLLSENDFTKNEMIAHRAIKGFAPLYKKRPGAVYNPFYEGDTEYWRPMQETMKLYLEKMVSLCKENGIRLVLVSVPGNGGIDMHNGVKRYAVENMLDYYDFNEAALYYETGYDLAEYGSGHVNIWGAKVITDHIGKILTEIYSVVPRTDASFDRARENYYNSIQNYELCKTTNLNEYLEKINSERYSVFVFAPSGFDTVMDAQAVERYRALGFETDLRGVTEEHYAAFRSGGVVEERAFDGSLFYRGAIRNGRTLFSIRVDTSDHDAGRHVYSCVVAGRECGGDAPGIRFAVFDNDLRRLIDVITFNTAAGVTTGQR